LYPSLKIDDYIIAVKGFECMALSSLLSSSSSQHVVEFLAVEFFRRQQLSGPIQEANICTKPDSVDYKVNNMSKVLTSVSARVSSIVDKESRTLQEQQFQGCCTLQGKDIARSKGNRKSKRLSAQRISM